MSTKIPIGDLLRKPTGTLVQKELRISNFQVEGLANPIDHEFEIDLLNFSDGVVAMIPKLDIPTKLACDFCEKLTDTEIATNTAETIFYLHLPDGIDEEAPVFIDTKHMEIDIADTFADAIQTAIPLSHYCKNCESKSHSYKDNDPFMNPFAGL